MTRTKNTKINKKIVVGNNGALVLYLLYVMVWPLHIRTTEPVERLSMKPNQRRTHPIHD